MAKITTEVRYCNTSYELSTKIEGLRVFTNIGYCDQCILVNDKDEVVLEINADTAQEMGYLHISKVEQ